MRHKNRPFRMKLVLGAMFIAPSLGLAGPMDVPKVPRLQISVGAGFRARVDHVVDGDTLRVAVPAKKSLLSFFKKDQYVQVRLPVLTLPSAQDKPRQWLLENVKGKDVTVQPEEVDGYGRVVGDVMFHDGRSLSDVLESLGLAQITRYTLPLHALTPAQELLDAGRFEDAVAFLQRQIGFDPNHSASRNSVIRRLRGLGYTDPSHH